MSAQTNITAFDGAATPISHVLTAAGVKVLKDGTMYALWREFNAALPTEACTFMEQRQRKLPSGVVESRNRVVTPVMESVAGQNAQGYTAMPKLAFSETDEWVKYSHPRSTGAVRNLNMQLLRNVANNVSTTVTPVASGVMYETMVTQVFPS